MSDPRLHTEGAENTFTHEGLNKCTKNKIYRDILYYYNVKYKIYY